MDSLNRHHFVGELMSLLSLWWKFSFVLPLAALAVLTTPVAVAQNFYSVPALSFTMAAGGANPLPQVVAIASTGTQFAFSVTPSTSSGGNWLTASPTGGGCCATPEAVTISVNGSTLSAGTYTGQIIFAEYFAGTPSITVPVTLTVVFAGGAFFGDVAGQASFSMVPGGKAPPGQNIQIQNGGTGSLSWTATASTADGGNWLNVPVQSGTAPSAVTVDVAPASLPGGGSTAGTFIGQVVFKATGSSVTVPVSVTVGASVFTQINPIYVTMPEGGGNPLPQVLDVSSTGSTNYSFGTSVYTGTGGSWLSISNKGVGCCATPEAVTVSVTASTLTAGTYIGEVVITQYFENDLWMTVPVVLTVEAPGGAYFDSVPGELSFFRTTTETPAAQAIPIRNAGTGTLNWTASESTADGGAWLSLSATSGTAPGSVSVTIVPSALPGAGATAGTFDGQVVLQTAGDIVTIPVSVTVGANMFAQVNAISFTMMEGASSPLPQNLAIASTGTSFAFSSAVYTGQGGNWLTLSNLGGECCNTPEGITVSIVNASALPAGTYSGEIVFTQYFQQTMGLTVPVTLTVVGSGTPFFDSLPGQLSFSMTPGGNAPPAQPIQIRNAGTGTLHWTLATSTADGGSWLTASAVSGTAPTSVSISIIPTALPNGGAIAGTFNGQVVLQGSGDVVTIPISVTVGASVFTQVNPINFTMPVGGANPLPQILAIASTGTTFTFSSAVYTSTGGNWLSISNLGGECCNTPEAITVSVINASTLAAGTYSGEIVFTQYFERNLIMTVPVTLTVSAPTTPFFDNLPGQMTFLMKAGGTPPSQTVQVRNGGAGTLSFTVKGTTADGGKWLTVSPASGKATATVTVTVIPANLPGGGSIAGTFAGAVAFTAGTDVATIPISVMVGPNIFNQLNGISFTMAAGGANPLPQVLPVVSNGANFTFSAASYNANGGAWLAISNKGGECCNTPEAITVSVNASTLPAGTYTGEITFTQYFQQTIWMTVPVTLTVVACGPFFDSVQGQLSYSFAPSSNNPPSQTVTIRNAGAGTLSWSLSTMTSDNSKWLAASAASGTAPSAVTVMVKSASLPGGGLIAGTYTGALTLTSGLSSVTIPVSVTVGANVFTQVSPMSFSMTLGGSAPPSQMLAISSTGTNFTYSASESTATGGAWLKISPTGGECCNTPDDLTVSIIGTSLAAGTYTGEIILTQYFQQDLWMVVPVTFTVTDPHIPASITATAGTPQTATVGTAFATNLAATVKDASGNAVSGLLVTFNAPTSGASGTFACSGNTAITNAAGVATAPAFTANTVAGKYTVTATGASLTTNPGYSMTNKAGPPASIVATAGTPQSATVNTAFPTNLAVTVTDIDGNPVSGATVTFTAPASGASGSFAGGVNTAKTNAQGVATAGVFTANTVAGSYTVTAKVGAVTTNPGFALTNQAGAAAAITATAGTPQSAAIHTAFATNLAATVTDAFGNAVSGATVTFTAPASGASGTFAGGSSTAMVTTSASGVATAPVFTANGTTGGYTVSAKVGTITASPGFLLTNTN